MTANFQDSRASLQTWKSCICCEHHWSQRVSSWILFHPFPPSSLPLFLPPSSSCSLSPSLFLSLSLSLSLSIYLSISLSLSLSCSVLKFLQESNSLKTWQTIQRENNSNLVSWICPETETRINLYIPGCSHPCRICADTQTQAHTYIHSGQTHE